MKFSIVVVTFNSAEVIKECIHSILRFTSEYSIEIIVVDNCSTDSTVDIVERLNIKCIIIKTGLNLGYSKAANLGALKGKGDVLIFCNPDVFIVEDIFGITMSLFFKDDRIACLSPKIVSVDGQEENFAFKFPKDRGLINILYRKLFNVSTQQLLQINNEYQAMDFFECDWVLGACFIVKKKIFFEVGMFDEVFFLNYEEIDLCRRVKRMNYKVIAQNKIKVVHVGGHSKKQENALIMLFRRINSEYRYHKNI